MSDRVPRGRVSMQQSVHSGGYDLWKYSREKCVCVSDFFIKYSTYHRLVQHWLLKVLKPQCCAARKWRGPVHNGCMSGLGTYWTKIKQWHPTKERRRKKKAKKKDIIRETFVAKTTLSSDTTDCIISRSLAQGLYTYIIDVQGQRVAANKDLSREQPTG